MDRYAECRILLERSAVKLPPDPRDLKEWSLVMAVTGLMTAIDRGLLGNVDGCTIHASGSYAVDDFRSIPTTDLRKIGSAQQMLSAL
jgi:hypothetical protein